MRLCLVLLTFLWAEDQRLHLCILSGARVNEPLRLHRVEDDGLPFLRCDEVREGGELGGRVRNAREHGCLGKVKRSGGLPVVALRGGIDPVKSRAVVYDIQIHLEDFVLGVGELNVECKQELLRLARKGLLVREKEILDELLRDRTRAFLDASVLDVDERRASHAREVESCVFIEAAILDGDDGTLQL